MIFLHCLQFRNIWNPVQQLTQKYWPIKFWLTSVHSGSCQAPGSSQGEWNKFTSPCLAKDLFLIAGYSIQGQNYVLKITDVPLYPTSNNCHWDYSSLYVLPSLQLVVATPFFTISLKPVSAYPQHWLRQCCLAKGWPCLIHIAAPQPPAASSINWRLSSLGAALRQSGVVL